MQHSTHCTTIRLALCLLGVFVLGGLAASLAAGETGLTPERKRTVVLPVGRSAILHFDRMKRVEVVETSLVEVVVANLNDLAIYARKEGLTTVYVWDRFGTHQIEVNVQSESLVDKVMRDLRGVLGPRLTYTPSGEDVLVVEGFLPAAEAERAHAVLKSYSGKKFPTQGGEDREVTLLDMVQPEGAEGGPALAAAEGLRAVLGEDLKYVVWNYNTLFVSGAVNDEARLNRARQVIEATKAAGTINVVDLIQYEPANAIPPTEAIAQAVGNKLQVWRLMGKTVAVEGAVSSKAEMDNVTKILDAFKDQATIVNLVRIEEPRPSINEVMALVQAALGNQVTVRPLANEMLLIEGTFANDQRLADVRELIKSLRVPYQIVDTLRVALPERRQVLVHVRVIDINRTELERLGVNYGQLEYDDDTVAFVDQPFLMQLERGIDNVLDFGAQVEALRRDNLARVLSEPNLLVDEGGKANILVGGEIPVPMSQAAGGASSVTVEWKQFGVLLEMQPTILEGSSKINIALRPEVSSLDYSNAVTLGGFIIPAMRSRKASTVVTMESGRTLVIGGLLSTTDTKVISKIPILGDIPILGELFKHKEFQEGKSELVISVTPEIVTGDEN